jgi:hypothetical protein
MRAVPSQATPHSGGYSLHKGNVAAGELDVRHYRFTAHSKRRSSAAMNAAGYR